MQMFLIRLKCLKYESEVLLVDYTIMNSFFSM